MPFVNVKVAGTLNKKQKAEIAAQITKTLQEVAGKAPEHTYVAIEELPHENWGVGGKLLG